MSISYDRDGRRTSLTLPNGIAVTYSYDTASQLRAINYGSLGTLMYSYDLAGRRTTVGGSFAKTGVPNALTTSNYNADNQLTEFGSSQLSYDANGNLTNDGTNTYTWSARNQLVGISGAVSANFRYDALGRRVSKTVSGTTQYLYDGMSPIEELSGTTVVATTLGGLGTDEYFQRTDSSGPVDFLSDALGNTLALTDKTGVLVTQYTYEPFGQATLTGAASGNPFQFTGRENDSTGLYFYRARYYDPALGRFIAEDPSGRAGGVNAYAYAGDDPADLVDPFGMKAKPPCGPDGRRFTTPAEEEKILAASQQPPISTRTYNQQVCNQFVCNSINASNTGLFLVGSNPVNTRTIAGSPDFGPVSASQTVPGDIVVFSNPLPYHMGFIVSPPGTALTADEMVSSATEHGGINDLGGPRSLPEYSSSGKETFPGTQTFYRPRVPCK